MRTKRFEGLGNGPLLSSKVETSSKREVVQGSEETTPSLGTFLTKEEDKKPKEWCRSKNTQPT
jgi:hypothetical protein